MSIIIKMLAVIDFVYKEDSNSRYRGYMEYKGKSIDCFIKVANSALFCLFNSNGRNGMSDYLQSNCPNDFKFSLPSNSIESILTNVFQSIDEKIKKSNYFNIGST